jgi:hypothetical protein
MPKPDLDKYVLDRDLCPHCETIYEFREDSRWEGVEEKTSRRCFNCGCEWVITKQVVDVEVDLSTLYETEVV